MRNRLPAIWVSIFVLSSVCTPKTTPLLTLYSSCCSSAGNTARSRSNTWKARLLFEGTKTQLNTPDTDAGKDCFCRAYGLVFISSEAGSTQGSCSNSLRQSALDFNRIRTSSNGPFVAAQWFQRQPWSSSTYQSPKVSSHHQSRSDTALPPTAPQPSVSFKPGRGFMESPPHAYTIPER